MYPRTRKIWNQSLFNPRPSTHLVAVWALSGAINEATLQNCWVMGSSLPTSDISGPVIMAGTLFGSLQYTCFSQNHIFLLRFVKQGTNINHIPSTHPYRHSKAVFFGDSCARKRVRSMKQRNKSKVEGMPSRNEHPRNTQAPQKSVQRGHPPQ